MAIAKYFSGFFRYLEQHWAVCLIIFATYFIGAKSGQHLFHIYDLSPAVIWPPTGIALAAVFLYGNFTLIVIALAHTAVLFTAPVSTEPPLVIGAMIFGAVFQAYIGAYMLRQLDFKPKLGRTHDAIQILLAAFGSTLIAPAIVTAAQFFTDSLTTPAAVTLSRMWAGGVLSVIVLSPLIFSWQARGWPRVRFNKCLLETVSAFAALMIITYCIFWTTAPEDNLFFLLYSLLICFFWIGLRLYVRSMTVAIFLFTALGLAGIFIVAPLDDPFSQRTFVTELFILLVGPIFLILASTVDEKREAHRTLMRYSHELERSLEQLADSDKLKNEFIATLAHELRNPLASIMSVIEVLRLEPSKDDEIVKLIDGTYVQVAGMRRLLADLLDLTRITHNRFSLQYEYFDLRTVVTQSIEALDAERSAANHVLEVHLPDAPISMYADPVRVGQIIVNLLSNAVKYTPSGGQITLNVQVKAAPPSVVIEVTDTGIGIAPEDQENIFEMYQQVARTQSDRSGLGIGLTLTKRLISMHGGEIAVESAGVGMGSCFRVTLPLGTVPALPSAVAKTLPATPVPREQTAARVPATVLVVDDNEAAAHALRRLLKHRGYKAVAVHTGKQAIAEALTLRPKVILLDIGLPDMSGYEVLDILKKQDVAASVVALSGYGQKTDRLKAEQSGFARHLTKPVGIDEVTAVIESLMR